MKGILKFGGLLILIGFINTLILLAFETIVEDGQQFIWNDVFRTNEFRILVIPVAAALSIVYSFILRRNKIERVGKPHVGLVLDEAEVPHTLRAIGFAFFIGAVGLLAGASLGPEAILFVVSAGLGIWFAKESKTTDRSYTYQLASIGALFVAFLGSLIMILVPIFMAYQKEKKLTLGNVVPPVVAGLAAYYLLLVLADGQGYGKMPIEAGFRLQDLATAFILGIAGAGVAVILKFCIKKLSVVAHEINKKTNWILSAAIFGLILGLLYLVGGEYVQFSGREGSRMLIEQASVLTLLPLVLILITKVFATAWSLASGYRGGLVFPSICIAVALALTIAQFGPFASTGMGIGAITGIIAVMSSPVLAFLFVAALVPVSFLPAAATALAGALIGVKIIKMFQLRKAGGE